MRVEGDLENIKTRRSAHGGPRGQGALNKRETATEPFSRAVWLLVELFGHASEERMDASVFEQYESGQDGSRT